MTHEYDLRSDFLDSDYVARWYKSYKSFRFFFGIFFGIIQAKYICIISLTFSKSFACDKQQFIC